jgi:hypothetical protein
VNKAQYFNLFREIAFIGFMFPKKGSYTIILPQIIQTIILKGCGGNAPLYLGRQIKGGLFG